MSWRRAAVRPWTAPRPSAGASSATSTTAPSSASSPWPSASARRAERLDRGPETGGRLVVEQSHEEAKAALKEIRDLVRGIHPVILEDRGLDAALSAVVARSPVPVTLDVQVGRAPAGRGRERRLLRRRRGPDQRGPSRRCHPGVGSTSLRPAIAWSSRSATTASAAPTRRRRHRPARPARPGHRPGRQDARHQPARWADHPLRGAAVRIVIAEDSVLLRAGLTRLLADAGEEVVAHRRRRRRADPAWSARHQPDLAVVDVRMPPTHTDDGLRRRPRGSGAGGPTSGSSCSPSTSRSATPPSCWPATPPGSATC